MIALFLLGEVVLSGEASRELILLFSYSNGSFLGLRGLLLAARDAAVSTPWNLTDFLQLVLPLVSRRGEVLSALITLYGILWGECDLS